MSRLCVIATAALLAVQDAGLSPQYLRERDRIDRELAREGLSLAQAAARRGCADLAIAELRRLERIFPEDRSLQRAIEQVERTRAHREPTAEERAAFEERFRGWRERFAERYRRLAELRDGAPFDDAADARARAEVLEGVAAPQSVSGGGPARPDDVLARINRHRRAAGLDGVAWDEDLARGAALHAEYLRLNPDVLQRGLEAHEEDPQRPGFTPEGQRAGRHSDIAYVPLDDAVEAWMATLYHRIPLLRPTLRRVGGAHVQGGPWNWIAVLDCVSGCEGSWGDRVVLYPPPDGRDVPLEFGGETPDPIPAGAPRPAGYPITVHFPPGWTVVRVHASLRRGTAEVPFHLSTPESPATDFPQQDTVCIIPERRLEPRATYSVRVEATVNGTARTFEWSFTTAER